MLETLLPPALYDDLNRLTLEREGWLSWKPFREIAALWDDLPQREGLLTIEEPGVVAVGNALAPDHPDRLAVARAARAIMPWKKGPYRLLGTDIDAEWRSDFKWDRFAQHLPNQKDKVVVDVGGNNGYYLFRLAPQKPRYMLCMDPVPRLWYQYELLQRYAGLTNMDFRMWGWEQLAGWESVCDTLLCMGILYHHRDPIQLLQHLNRALKPGGLLVMESIIIPGAGSVCLFPPDRYARMRNVWFIPTLEAMTHMLSRTGFVDLKTVAVNRHEPAEQRPTDWNPGASFSEFLDPKNPDLTIEGHPAPHRAIITAYKKGC